MQRQRYWVNREFEDAKSECGMADLNRLSDYLFVVGRYCNLLLNSVESKRG